MKSFEDEVKRALPRSPHALRKGEAGGLSCLG